MAPTDAAALMSPQRHTERLKLRAARSDADLDMSWVRGSGGSHTSHLAAADSDGNVACSTQTLGGLFGCQVWSDGLPVNGFGAYLLSDDPAAPASLIPNSTKQ